MKLNRLLAMCGMAALCLSAATLMAQDTGGNGGQGGRRQRDNAGNAGGGGGNFDPAQRQQMMMERYKERLGFTNDTEWNAVQPLIQKVAEAQREARAGALGQFGRGNRGPGGDQGGGNPPGGGRFGAAPSPEEAALQKAIDDNAPSAQIKDLLAKYKAARKDKQAKLEAAQGDLRKVLTVKQEASATLLGLLQ